jgi:acyl-coenzyme A synthetase/AMP-(fatty) acid ligase
MIKEQGITVSSFVPGVLQYVEKYLDEFSFPALRFCFFSGDKLLQTLAEKWHKVAKNALIYNCYGPTETTIVCTEYFWHKDLSSEEAHNNIVSLGKPFENMQTVFLDDHDNVNRVSGELCFSGPQVIDAYLDEKQNNKFFDFEGNRYYKTGDLAGYNKNGNLVFYGRKDSQVKINGYRVELLEVEQAIRHVTKKNVVVQPNTTNEMPVLIAFIETSELDVMDLKINLKEILPDYMIPNSYKLVQEFPKNTNGKIDMQQLKKMTDAGKSI